ncbi:MAG: 3-phosphoshikimate 1-carboxyvinyltransferase [Candidatus Hydrothermarchaeales archaeon]
MDVIVKSSDIRDFTFAAPPSKSYTHRAYAIASLAEGTSLIKNPLRAGDTDSTLQACRAFGAGIEEKEREVTIKGTGGRLATPVEEVDVENSGTTIRLFTSIAALNGKVRLTGDESIKRRPMQPLLDALAQLGVKATSVRGNGMPPVELKGGNFTGGATKIRGDISSQFISSLLVASPYAERPVTIELTTPLKSRPYVDVTLDIMKTFGIDIGNKGYYEFAIPNGMYKAREYTVEGDYSSSSYFLTLASLCSSKTTVKNLPKQSVQGDKTILEILKKMGAQVTQEPNSVTVEGAALEGIEVDLGNTPDLLPTIAALASAAKGTTTIKNIAHARLKESDRVAACAKEFAKFGASIEEGKDFLVIEGAKRLKGGKVNSYGDHRMVMALAILGVCAEGETVINHAESVGISFPGFFDALKGAGARVEQ